MHDDLLTRREDYPILSRSTYLINNSLGAMHRETRKRLQDYADLWDTEGVVAWNTWFPEMTHVANLVGATIGAPPGTTVLRQSVADAIVAVASCFDLRERRVVRQRAVAGEMARPAMRDIRAAGDQRQATHAARGPRVVDVANEGLVEPGDGRCRDGGLSDGR